MSEVVELKDVLTGLAVALAAFATLGLGLAATVAPFLLLVKWVG